MNTRSKIAIHGHNPMIKQLHQGERSRRASLHRHGRGQVALVDQNPVAVVSDPLLEDAATVPQVRGAVEQFDLGQLLLEADQPLFDALNLLVRGLCFLRMCKDGASDVSCNLAGVELDELEERLVLIYACGRQWRVLEEGGGADMVVEVDFVRLVVVVGGRRVQKVHEPQQRSGVLLDNHDGWFVRQRKDSRLVLWDGVQGIFSVQLQRKGHAHCHAGIDVHDWRISVFYVVENQIADGMTRGETRRIKINRWQETFGPLVVVNWEAHARRLVHAVFKDFRMPVKGVGQHMAHNRGV